MVGVGIVEVVTFNLQGYTGVKRLKGEQILNLVGEKIVVMLKR